ncbi:Nucleic acid-binding protein [Corchorus olitorius]|uniref:Nucleic acid-binding protein n=1 Tax=Corchorus olitorius TaxID=93759 RepID=A0A1R3I388_9ROSI|nr:Nucleic acid-binding protein [Corchorus olitorius]
MSLRVISQLAPPGQNQMIKLRITRIWECIIPTTRKLIGIAFLGTDDKGDAIHVHIPLAQATKFRPMFAEGMLFHLSRFQVVIPFMRNLAVSRTYAILFNKNTVAKPIPDDPRQYPRHYFEFATMEKINQLCNSDKYLVDAYGIGLSITDSEEVYITTQNRDAGKKDIMIKRMNGNEMRVIVWESCFNQIDVDELLRIRPAPVLIFAAMTVRTFGETTHLVSTSATKFYMNLDIPEVSLIQNRYEGQFEKMILIETGNSQNEMGTSSRDRTIFKVQAVVEEVDTSDGWFYKACHICNKKLDKNDIYVGCIKMSLPIRLRDETAEMDLTAFDRDAEQLTNTYISNLPTYQELSQENVPDGILVIKKKKFQFKLGLTKKVVEQNSPTYRIYSATMMPEETAIETNEKDGDNSDNCLVNLESENIEDQISYSPDHSRVDEDLFAYTTPKKKSKTKTGAKEKGKKAPPGLNQSIRLRVTRMWNCVLPASGRIISLAFLGTDMEIGQRDVEHYRALLIEGALYLLSAFRVSRPNINMISVRSAHVIWLTSRSVLHPINDDLGPFPRHSFAFNCEHHLRQMANRNRFLADIIGFVLQMFEEIIVEVPGSNRMFRRRDFTILTLYNRDVTVRVWGETLDQIDPEVLLQIVPRPVLIFAGMLVRDGEVNPFLNSCFATQIYVNLPINETAMVAVIYEDIDGPIEMMPPANQPPNHPPQ